MKFHQIFSLQNIYMRFILCSGELKKRVNKYFVIIVLHSESILEWNYRFTLHVKAHNPSCLSWLIFVSHFRIIISNYFQLAAHFITEARNFNHNYCFNNGKRDRKAHTHLKCLGSALEVSLSLVTPSWMILGRLKLCNKSKPIQLNSIKANKQNSSKWEKHSVCFWKHCVVGFLFRKYKNMVIGQVKIQPKIMARKSLGEKKIMTASK